MLFKYYLMLCQHTEVVIFSHILAVLNNDHLNIVNFSPEISYSFIRIMHFFFVLFLVIVPHPCHFHSLRKVERAQTYHCWNSRSVD